jgi:D-alanyl-D-alanine carboxypeptidase
MRDYPQYYHYFGLKSFDFHGKTLMNHNHLVAKMPGVDGMKTGYTSLAGFNLVASGVRDGHRLITVVLGGPSVAARDENVEELLDAGFTVLRGRGLGQRLRLASLISSPEDMGGPVTRPPVEEGSGDQQNLRVELDPQLHSPAMSAAAAAVAEEPDPQAQDDAKVAPVAQADCAPVRRARRRHRRHEPAACETATAKATPAKPAPDKTASAKPAPDKDAPAKVAREKAKAANADVAAADAPCKPHGRHRRAACKAAAVQTADAAPAKVEKAGPAKGGGYMIQVGAYKSRALAKGQVDKIEPLVSGDGAVEEANGNYRARFRGLSRSQAAAACHSLSAKGQACMVMSDS